MSEERIAPMQSWLAGPMDANVSEAIERLRRARDIQRVAVMPDVHLSADVCIGVAVATSSLIYPQAVGGDIGCGMLAVATDMDQTALDNPRAAGQVLSELSRAVPARRRNRRETVSQPGDLAGTTLSHTGLESVRQHGTQIQQRAEILRAPLPRDRDRAAPDTSSAQRDRQQPVLVLRFTPHPELPQRRQQIGVRAPPQRFGTIRLKMYLRQKRADPQ